MRTTFTITLKADIKTEDPVARDVFRELLKDNAETLYAQCSTISRRPPTIAVTITDDEVGTIIVPLFGQDTYEEDYSGE